MRLRWLGLLSTLLVLSVPAHADCEGAFESCKEEECEYSTKSAAIAIGSAIAATQGRQAASGASREPQRELDSCMRQCEQQRLSCRADSRQRDAEQARERVLDQRRAAQLEGEANAALAGGGGSSSVDLSHPKAGKALKWIADAGAHYKAKRYREALEHYESALEILPDHAEAHFGAMQSAEALKESATAKAHAVRYLELEPDDPNSKAIRRKYPALVQAQKQREAAAAKAPLPPRPALPAEVPEIVWQKLEASAAYRAYRTTIGVRSHVLWDHHWQSSDGEHGSINFERDIRIQPASAATSRETTQFVTNMGPNTEESVTTFGGLIEIASHTSGALGVSGWRLLDIENLDGSLFPPKVGAVMRMTLLWEQNLNGNLAPYRKTQTCRVSGSMPARRVAPQLPGLVWAIECSVETESNGRPNPVRTEKFAYYDTFATMGSQFLWSANHQLSPYFPSIGDEQPDSLDGTHTVKAFDMNWE